MTRIVAVDIGTSSVRAISYHEDGRRRRAPVRQARYRGATAAEIPADALAAAFDACTGGLDADIVAVASFWHGLLGIDAAGCPVTPALTWADVRSAPQAQALRAQLDEPATRLRTGCRIHPSYWPSKLAWLRDEAPDAARRARWWVSPVDWLLMRATGAKEPVTSVSMASATGLWDRRQRGWDAELLAAVGVRPEAMTAAAGPAAHARFAGPWGDGACGLIGSGGARRGTIALNVGTSAAVRALTTHDAPAADTSLWMYMADDERAVEGAAYSDGGSLLQWVAGLTGCRDVEAAAEAAGRADRGPVLLPGLAGERSPGWPVEAHGALAGLDPTVTALEIVGAACEAVALRIAGGTRALLERTRSGGAIVASGAALRGTSLAQLICDAIGRPVLLARDRECTARGAALLAAETRLGLPLPEAPPPGVMLQPDRRRHNTLQRRAARLEALSAAVSGRAA